MILITPSDLPRRQNLLSIAEYSVVVFVVVGSGDGGGDVVVCAIFVDVSYVSAVVDVTPCLFVSIVIVDSKEEQFIQIFQNM